MSYIQSKCTFLQYNQVLMWRCERLSFPHRGKMYKNKMHKLILSYTIKFQVCENIYILHLITGREF